jgi:hypothetical protein
MESNSEAFFIRQKLCLDFKPFGMVIPNLDIVLTASSDELFSEAGVHSSDFIVMEVLVHVVKVVILNTHSIQRDHHFHQLVTLSHKVQHVFLCV